MLQTGMRTVVVVDDLDRDRDKAIRIARYSLGPEATLQRVNEYAEYLLSVREALSIRAAFWDAEARSETNLG